MSKRSVSGDNAARGYDSWNWAPNVPHPEDSNQSGNVGRSTSRRWSSFAALSFISLTLSGLIPPHRSGFVCGDLSIHKTYHGDSISIYTLCCGVLLGPIILFAVTEAIHQSRLYGRTDSEKVDFPDPLSRNSFSRGRQRFLNLWGHLVGDYFLGFVYLFAIVELGKVLMGELRPHFLDTCRPDWALINCSQGMITKYVCLGDVPKWLKVDMFKSFPSGHAAFSTYAFTFSSMYSQKRIYRSNYSHLIRSWVQLLFLMWACLCSLTRLTDNRHHWWDVLVGIFLGVVAGVFTAKCIVKNGFDPNLERYGNKQRFARISGANDVEPPNFNHENRTTSL